jgi:hypothetical protein
MSFYGEQLFACQFVVTASPDGQTPLTARDPMPAETVSV